MTRATVVVPTRDRPASLAACLAALAAQTVDDFDVVVVDDGSVDASAVAEVVARAPRARLERAGGNGPAAARNRGAALATGSIVCFTDDDCRPDPGWLAALLAPFDTGATVVAGPTLARGGPVDAAAQTVTNHLMDASPGFAPTSNLAVRTELFRTLPFDETFPLAAGEDRDWCARLAERGDSIVVAPDAVVWHHPDLTLRGFWRQQARYGRGARRVHRSGASLQHPRFYVALLRKGFAQGPRVGVLVGLAQVATAWGIVRERLQH